MKTISKAQLQALEDLSGEGLLGGLRLPVAEKDIHITDLLEALSKLEVRHAHFSGVARGEQDCVDDGITLVFAGGTCLSKAHGLINRMSEDVDIKVILSAPTRPLKRDISYRARLKALHMALDAMLEDLGLEVPEHVEGQGNPMYRDSHRYYMVDARYESTSPSEQSLRPDLKLETIHRHPLLAPMPVQFGYLYEHLGHRPRSKLVTMACISVAETLAEKVLSLLRRCHWKWSDLQAAEMDPALVRHVYDVYRIMRKRPEDLDVAATIFPELVAGDAEEFRGRDVDFEKKPREALLRTLRSVGTSEELRLRYDERVLPLIYDEDHTAFDEAFEKFGMAAERLINTLPT